MGGGAESAYQISFTIKNNPPLRLIPMFLKAGLPYFV